MSPPPAVHTLLLHPHPTPHTQSAKNHHVHLVSAKCLIQLHSSLFTPVCSHKAYNAGLLNNTRSCPLPPSLIPLLSFWPNSFPLACFPVFPINITSKDGGLLAITVIHASVYGLPQSIHSSSDHTLTHTHTHTPSLPLSQACPRFFPYFRIDFEDWTNITVASVHLHPLPPHPHHPLLISFPSLAFCLVKRQTSATYQLPAFSLKEA